jgi:hypothetical protein
LRCSRNAGKMVINKSRARLVVMERNRGAAGVFVHGNRCRTMPRRRVLVILRPRQCQCR